MLQVRGGSLHLDGGRGLLHGILRLQGVQRRRVPLVQWCRSTSPGQGGERPSPFARFSRRNAAKSPVSTARGKFLLPRRRSQHARGTEHEDRTDPQKPTADRQDQSGQIKRPADRPDTGPENTPTSDTSTPLNRQSAWRIPGWVRASSRPAARPPAADGRWGHNRTFLRSRAPVSQADHALGELEQAAAHVSGGRSPARPAAPAALGWPSRWDVAGRWEQHLWVKPPQRRGRAARSGRGC